MAHHDWPDDFDDHPPNGTAEKLITVLLVALILAGLLVAGLYATGTIF